MRERSVKDSNPELSTQESTTHEKILYVYHISVLAISNKYNLKGRLVIWEVKAFHLYSREKNNHLRDHVHDKRRRHKVSEVVKVKIMLRQKKIFVHMVFPLRYRYCTKQRTSFSYAEEDSFCLSFFIYKSSKGDALVKKTFPFIL